MKVNRLQMQTETICKEKNKNYSQSVQWMIDVDFSLFCLYLSFILDEKQLTLNIEYV